MRLLRLFLCVSLLAGYAEVAGQGRKIDTVSNFKVEVPVRKRFYIGNGLDFAMLSTAFVTKPGENMHLAMPRFTAVVNLGVTFNYDLNPRFGLMSGLGIRNMGFIEREKFAGDRVVTKRRVYSLGIPLGIKIGDLRNRNFIFAGGGIDLPFHYKEKVRSRKYGKVDKRGEWFADETPRIMPFIFAGYSFDPGITLKLQYYPGNFLNEDHKRPHPFGIQIEPITPFAGYEVHLLLLSLGIDIHYNQWRIQQREYQEMKRERQQEKKLL